MKGHTLFQGEIIVKISYQHLEIFFPRTTGPISTKLGTKHPWAKGVQVYTNEVPHLFRRGNNRENTLLTFKFILPRSRDLILTSLGTKHPLVLEIQVCPN